MLDKQLWRYNSDWLVGETYIDVVGVDVVRVGVSQEWVELDSVAVIWDGREMKEESNQTAQYYHNKI